MINLCSKYIWGSPDLRGTFPEFKEQMQKIFKKGEFKSIYRNELDSECFQEFSRPYGLENL